MRIKKGVGTALGAVAILIGAAFPALAAVEYPGGGTWNYGTNRTEVWSNYHHPSANHRSSVINGYGEYKSSGCKARGVWSYASLRADPNRVDHAYWSNSC
ncbi:MAG TPA: lactococcin 972 family bacteriocin [Propionibacteriaceae bacterium]